MARGQRLTSAKCLYANLDPAQSKHCTTLPLLVFGEQANHKSVPIISLHWLKKKALQQTSIAQHLYVHECSNTLRNSRALLFEISET